MKQIPLTLSVDSFRTDMTYSEAAMAADDDAKPFTPLFDEQLSQADEVERKERAARRTVIQFNAKVAVANVHADRLTMQLGYESLAEAGGNRSSPTFTNIFSTVPSLLVKWALRKQCEYIRDRVLPAVSKLPADSRLRPLAEQLGVKAATALDFLDRRSAAQGSRALVRNEVDEWKEGVNRLRLSTYADLLKIAAAKGYGRSWADTFFPKPERAEDTTEEPPADPPAGGEPTT